MDATTRRLVRNRGNDRCEYCGLRQDQSPLAVLHIEHILPKKHGGSDDDSNLALACIDCNLFKSSNIAGRDPETLQLTELFNPRTQNWDEHFERRGIFIFGRTDVGRTTIEVLNMNSDEALELRSVDPT